MTDKELRYWALNLWANYIETGDVSCSGENAAKIGIDRKSLNDYQLRTVDRLHALAIAELGE